MGNLLTAHEAAEYLRVSEATVLRWCRERKLPEFRIGREWRIPAEGLQRLVEHDSELGRPAEGEAACDG